MSIVGQPNGEWEEVDKPNLIEDLRDFMYICRDNFKNWEYDETLRKEIQDLKDNVLFLNCLRNAGVDNWDGYDFACEEYDKLKDN